VGIGEMSIDKRIQSNTQVDGMATTIKDDIFWKNAKRINV
jgi:hypothetical protein